MTTKSVSSFVFCPSCGLLGQLILKTAKKGYKSMYYGVLHFKDKKGRLKKRVGSHFHQRYAYFCYLGKIAVFDTMYNLFFPETSAYAVAQRLVHFL